MLRPKVLKKGPAVGAFIYDLICRYGVMDITITDQGTFYTNLISFNKSPNPAKDKDLPRPEPKEEKKETPPPPEKEKSDAATSTERKISSSDSSEQQASGDDGGGGEKPKGEAK